MSFDGRGADEAQTRTDAVTVDRRQFLGTTAGVSLATLGLSGVAGAEEAETLTIIHDTHFHGRFEDADEPEINIARYHTMVEQLRAEHENAIFLGIGDDIAPSILGLEFEGEHMIPALNYMEPAVIGAGNHEFDFGVEVAEQRFAESEFPWVISNLLTDEGEPVPGTERWTTLEVGDHTVGVFGMGVEGFHGITDFPEDWEVLGHEEATEQAVDALQDAGAEFIVCASHANTGDHPTIASVDGVDAVVGSHSGVVFDEPNEDHGAVISEFGDEFDHVGRLTFDVASGELVDWERIDLYNSEEGEPPSDHENHRPVDVHDVEEDAWLREHADEWLADLEEELGRPFFESEVALDATFDTNYGRESRWGNLMTDVMREVGDHGDGDGLVVDVAIQNSGGIRSDATYGPGEITGLDVMNILPFPNEIWVVEVTGAVLQQYLEDVTSPMTADSDYGVQTNIQVSGIQYEYVAHHGDTEIPSVYVGGEPLESEETYLVASNDFEIERTVLGEEGDLVLQSGQYLGPFTLDRLEERGTVAPEIDGRMLRVDADAGSHQEVVRRGGETLLRYDLPDAVAAIDPETFYGLTQDHDGVDPVRVDVEGDDLWLAFEAGDLESAIAGSDDLDLRVFGGFDPDDEYYGYGVDLPVGVAWEHYQLKATIDTSSPALRDC
ncbi:bifunctional metallophosphatase/5'-nucleotidase [Natrononativus amylolyticus]|uniref:bifunctional metallophosphatase/5'-nucleotidase n=1 Tax=Natrononativus amylolyticus TaxID=2963434 RepID=UPI0020CF26D4|nr:5'-nucleotidase C-terminal domain-containing protein [Natrononativus amylolyticus]